MQQGVFARVGIFVTQCRKNPTHGPYDETGSHGFHVAEHRLGGDEDPRADDGAHDDAGATEQAQLGCRGGGEELVLLQGAAQKARRSPLPSILLPSHAGYSQAAQSPRHLHPVLLQGEHRGAAPGDLCVRAHVCAHTLSHVQTLQLHQAPLSMGFSRQEYWSGVISPL